MHAQIRMAEMLPEQAWHVAVPLARLQVHLSRRAAHRALEDLQPGTAEQDFLPQPAELGPGGQAGEIDVGAETQRVELPADCLFQRPQAGEVDQGDALALLVGEGVARRLDEPELAARLGTAARAKALAEFDERIVISRTIDVYRELLPAP